MTTKIYGKIAVADFDRSRSPLPPRNRQEQPGQQQAFPCFPRWCGPMGSTVRSLSTMPQPQKAPKWLWCQAGPYGMGRLMTPTTPPFHQVGPCRPNHFHQLHRICINHNPCLSSFRVSSDTTLLTFSTDSHFTVPTQINWHHSSSLSVQFLAPSKLPESMVSTWMKTGKPIESNTTTTLSLEKE